MPGNMPSLSLVAAALLAAASMADAGELRATALAGTIGQFCESGALFLLCHVRKRPLPVTDMRGINRRARGRFVNPPSTPSSDTLFLCSVSSANHSNAAQRNGDSAVCVRRRDAHRRYRRDDYRGR
jgi:hypothetical protein